MRTLLVRARSAPLLLFALLLIPVLLVAQVDTLTDSTGSSPGGTAATLGFIIGYFFTNVLPLITTWVTKKYNTGQGWYASLGNGAKMAVYVAATALLMLASQWIGYKFDSTVDDVTNLGSTAIADIVKAVVVTLAVKAGITTAREKAPTAQPYSTGKV